MAKALLMPKATAVWLVDNTALSFEQIAQFCKLHPLEVKAIADGESAQGIKGLLVDFFSITRDQFVGFSLLLELSDNVKGNKSFPAIQPELRTMAPGDAFIGIIKRDDDRTLRKGRFRIRALCGMDRLIILIFQELQHLAKT